MQKVVTIFQFTGSDLVESYEDRIRVTQIVSYKSFREDRLKIVIMHLFSKSLRIFLKKFVFSKTAATFACKFTKNNYIYRNFSWIFTKVAEQPPSSLE